MPPGHEGGHRLVLRDFLDLEEENGDARRKVDNARVRKEDHERERERFGEMDGWIVIWIDTCR